MPLFFALHFYDYGLIRSAILFGAVILIIGPLVSGILSARLEVYFKEALWGWSSILIYPAAIWLAVSFSWFGIF